MIRRRYVVTMNRFEDRVVLVTGAANGIGRATMERLAGEGATVVAVDHQAGDLADAVATPDG